MEGSWDGQRREAPAATSRALRMLAVPVGAFAVFILSLTGLREWSWRHHRTSVQSKISILENDLDATIQRLQADEHTCSPGVHTGHLPFGGGYLQLERNGKVSDTDDGIDKLKFADVASKETFDFASPTGSQPSNGTEFTYFNVLLLTFFTAIKVHEMKRVHLGIYSNNKCYSSFEGNRKFQSFAAHWTPFYGLLMSKVLCIASVLAWFGVFNRATFVTSALKAIVCWHYAIPISQYVNNAYGIVLYLLRTRAQLQKNVSDGSWWLWLVSKTFGCERPEMLIAEFIRLALMCYFAWPYRYYLLYRSNCTGNADAVDIFIVNMIMQVSLLMTWLHSLQIVLTGSPKCLRNHWTLPTLRDTPLFTTASVIMVAVSMAICCLRVLWFVWTSGCTWYGAAVAWVFFHPHIMLPIMNLSLISTALNRHKFIAIEGEHFVSTLMADYRKRQDDEILHREAGEDIDSPSRKPVEVATAVSDGTEGNKPNDTCKGKIDALLNKSKPSGSKESVTSAPGNDEDLSGSRRDIGVSLADRKPGPANEQIYSQKNATLGESTYTEGGNGDSDVYDEEEERQLRAFADAMFVALLDKTVRNYVLDAGPISYYNGEERKKLREEKRNLAAAETLAEGDAGEDNGSAPKEYDDSYEDFLQAFDAVKVRFRVDLYSNLKTYIHKSISTYSLHTNSNVFMFLKPLHVHVDISTGGLCAVAGAF